MRPLGGPNTIWLCEAEKRSRNPDFAGLKTWPGGKATPTEGRETQGRRGPAARTGRATQSAAIMCDRARRADSG